MAPNNNILKNKVKKLDVKIKELKDRLNAMEWERKKYLQFYDNDSDSIVSHSST